MNDWFGMNVWQYDMILTIETINIVTIINNKLIIILINLYIQLL